MTAKQVFWSLIVTLVVCLVGLAGATYGFSTILQTKSQELATAKAEVDQLNNQRAGLAKAKRDVVRYADLEKITKTVVPQDKDQAQTVREITNIAAANNVSLTTITFPSSTLGAGTSAAASTAKPNLSQLTPVTNIPGVYNLQITIGNNSNNTVTFNQLDAFLRDLENNRRTAAVSSLSIQPEADRPSRIVFTLVINTYIKPS